MQSCATDPGHVLTVTGSLLNWTLGGLVARYGVFHLNELPDELRILVEDYELVGDDQIPVNQEGEPLHQDNLNYMWDSAIDHYNTSRQYWGTSMKICRRIAKILIAIGVKEDMFDYKIMATNFMDEMKAMRASEDEEEETPTKKKPSANGVNPR